VASHPSLGDRDAVRSTFWDLDQGRTQDRADGAKAPPRNPPKKNIYSFKSGAFYVSQFLHPLADYVPPDSID